ncbi:Cerato-platanin [Suillus spraguei]|nr:Cerato-platanin [Suillus spraguei]
MKFSFAAALLSVFALPALLSRAISANTSLSSVACSNGLHHFGSLPTFPRIGGIPNATWNSTLCGTCWNLKYTAANGSYQSINITAVDAADTFNLSEEASEELTNSTVVAAGKVAVNATQIAVSYCGL